MIKYFCDRCNKQMLESDYKSAPDMPIFDTNIPQFGPIQYSERENKKLCDYCMGEYYNFITAVKTND